MRALSSFAQIFNFSKFTYATVANNAAIGIAAIVACLIIYVIATTNTATTSTTIVGIIVVVGYTTTTTTTMSLMIKRANYCYYDLLVVPSIDNMPGAMPKSSSSSPFYACEYQNKACFGTL